MGHNARIRREETALPPETKQALAESSQKAASTQTICVVGLGYVGLPIAVVLAERGFSVTGVDIDSDVRSALAAGEARSSESGLNELLGQAVQQGRLSVADAPIEADVFLVAVPTPLSEDGAHVADLGYVRAAARSLTPVLRPGNLVILESTVPPGTTDEVLVPELERSGMKAGRDLLVAHVPERVLPGDMLAELTQNARVIGGVDRESAEAARQLYAHFVTGKIILTDARTAEMVKLMENTYRDVNVGLANEFATLAEELGVDVWQAIDIANQHPRVNIHRPGPGVGGHCVPVDPWFLANASDYPAPLIRAARAVNDAMPERIAATLHERLAGVAEPAVALLGLAYKGDTDDARNSPALAVERTLRSWGCDVRTYDPHVAGTCASAAEAVTGADAMLLMTDHREFQALDLKALREMMRGRLVFDARGLLDEATWRSAGFELQRLGAPNASDTSE